MSLNNAIEAVYEAFSDVEKPEIVDGCPCCMTTDEYDALTAKPLRELSSEELSDYSGDVFFTMGSEADYQYFLPRILELTIADDADWIQSAEITGNKLRMAGFDKWSEGKRSAIENLWLEVVRNYVKSVTDSETAGWAAWDISSWLGAATLIPISVVPLLTEIEASPDVVRELYDMNLATIFQGKLDNPFLEEPNDGQAEVAAWLRDRFEGSTQ
ncbi:MAG TPA: hypothetical protein PKA82_16610 [Pyrinomonadaceae bacterium]|nr:hypothetical protein [Pyrinomonadaceae bacterium]